MWNSWGCSVRGPRHRRKSQPNQDAWKARAYSWGNVLAVSDGLGSKPHSDIGSKAACNAVISAARHFAAHPLARIEAIPPLIHSLWQIFLGPYYTRDCCATCLFAMQISDRIILGRLGDGLIAALGDQIASVIMTDEKEESFSNITYCLSEKFRGELWEIRELQASLYPRIMICTDGVSDDLYEDHRESFSEEVFRNGNNLAELRRQLVEWPRPKHSDDKTIACLVNDEPPGSPDA